MSLITSKTNLTTPMLPLHAIPTEVIRKGFRPYRGFITSVPINLPEEDQALRPFVGMAMGPLTGEKSAVLALNVSPIYEVFARLFGYDAKLLNAGNGECGVEGHDWNLYGEKERTPQVVRWRGFDGGEALFCIGSGLNNYLATIVGLANDVMAPKMAQVFEAIGALRAEKKSQSVDVPMGNLLQKAEVETAGFRQGLSAGLWCAAKSEEPTDEQIAELQKVHFSCKVYAGAPWGMDRYKVRPDRIEAVKRNLRHGQRFVITHDSGRIPLTFEPGEPIPQAVIDQIYANSVEDVEKMMQFLLKATFETQDDRVQGFLEEEALAVTVGDPEENERVYALAYHINQAEKGNPYGPSDTVLQTSFSRNFYGTPAKTLVGTESVKRLVGGHVRASADLIDMLINKVSYAAADRLRGRNNCFELLGRVIASDDLELKRDQMAAHSQSYELEKPYTALYRGLPIRVTDSHVVYHGDGSEGLACDYYVDHQNQALHFVSLYRVKAPKTE